MIVVTGADGYLGSRVCSALDDVGECVVEVVRSETPRFGSARWEMDLENPDHFKEIPVDSLDDEVALVHLAGKIDISLQPNGRAPTEPPVPGPQDVPGLYSANTLTTANLASFGRKIGASHFLYASSQSVYGLPTEREVTEGTPLQPLEHYANSKRCAEELLRLCSPEQLPVTLLRLPGLFDDSRRDGLLFGLSRSLVTDGVAEVRIQYPLPLDVLHVDDAISAIRKAVETPTGSIRTLNVSYGRPCSATILACELARFCDGEVTVDGVDQPTIEFSGQRARGALGWEPADRRDRLRSFFASVRAEFG